MTTETSLFFDTETYSECDLKAHGTHRYAEHPSTEIMVAQWAIGDGETVVEDLSDGTPPSARLLALLEDPSVIVYAHNSAFDRCLVRHVWGVEIPIHRWRDTMVKALCHGLPGALGKLGPILGLPVDQQKDKRGTQLIQLFCKPRPKGHKLRRATRDTHPAEWAEFLGYSYQDVPAMRAVDKALPNWNYRGDELALWHLDQRINDRGFAIDLELAEAAIAATNIEKTRLKEEVTEATDGLVTSVSKVDTLLAYILAEHGVTLPDMRADTLRRRLDDPDLPDAVKLLLSLRLEGTKTSTAKFNALIKATSYDGRLRNALQFAGALRTSRWAGRIFQPQNMPRPDIALIAKHFGVSVKDLNDAYTQAYEDQGIAALKGHFADFVFDNVMGLTANLVRAAIVAPPFKKLCIADLANIEGRGLAYLAGEDWKIKAFKEYDAGTGPDLYLLAYAKAFNIPVEDVQKWMRQVGKVMELGCFAADTPVVTSNGVKAIVEVSETDLLWDGTSWVKHEGLLERGVKQVVNVAGIELTPDHLILVNQTWQPAQQLVLSESTLHQALATGSVNLPLSVYAESERVRATWKWSRSSAPAGQTHTPSAQPTCEKAAALAATRALKSKQATGEKSFTDTLTSCQTRAIECAFLTEYPHASCGATTLTTRAILTTGEEAFSFTSSGAQTAELFSRTLSRLKAGITRFLNWTAKTSTATTRPVTCGLLQSETTKSTEEKSEPCKKESLNSKPVFDILNAGPNNRFTILTDQGPLIVHNCGYQGGVSAYLTFAAVYNMDLDGMAEAVWASAPAEALEKAAGTLAWVKKKKRSTFGLSDRVYIACELLKASWRAAHPATEQFWHDVEDATAKAILNSGEAFRVRQLVFRRDGSWLRIRLPSGRYLCYLNPEINDKGEITYMGVNQYTRQWSRIKTYGGKLVENIVQAWARDVLAFNMPAIDEAGYEIVLTVHDELLTETPDTDDYNWETLAAMMARQPPWAPGVPLSAAGFETYRYRKD